MDRGVEGKPGNLDLLLLALVRSGVSTPYEMRVSAGLSEGATIASLRRLVQLGFLRRGSEQSRGRSPYEITRAGKETLRTLSRALLEREPAGIFDEDLRVAILILHLRPDGTEGAEYLRNCVSLWSEKRARAPEPQSLGEGFSAAEWHRLARTIHNRNRLSAELQSFEDLLARVGHRAAKATKRGR